MYILSKLMSWCACRHTEVCSPAVWLFRLYAVHVETCRLQRSGLTALGGYMIRLLFDSAICICVLPRLHPRGLCMLCAPRCGVNCEACELLFVMCVNNVCRQSRVWLCALC